MRQRSTPPLYKTLLATIVAGLPSMAAAAPAQPPPAENRAQVFRGSQDLPDSAGEAWAATVSIETRSFAPASGGREVASGSGVVLARDGDGAAQIATSAHVVACDAACLIRVGFGDEASPVRARILWRDPGQDLALLTALPPAGTDVRIARSAGAAKVDAGGRLLAIGFPDPGLADTKPKPRRAKRFSDGRMVDARGGFRADYRAYSSSAVEGQLSPDAVLLHTAELAPGSSGGPLIDVGGAVVGISTGSLVSTQGAGCARAETADGEHCLHLAVAVDAVLELIAEIRQGCQPTTAPSAWSSTATN